MSSRNKRPLTLVDKFDRNLTRRLTEMVKERRALYDDQMEDNKDIEFRTLLWKEIGQELLQKSDFETVEMLKTKWKSIKDSFSKSYKLYIIRKHKGLHWRKPTAYNRMSFYIPFINKRQIIEALDMDCMPEDLEDEIADNVKEESTNTIESTEEIDNYEEDKSTHEDPLSVFYPQIKETLQQSYTANANQSNAVMEDEIETFFQSLAKTVKRLKPLNQAMVKKTIANVILDFEIKEAQEAEQNK